MNKYIIIVMTLISVSILVFEVMLIKMGFISIDDIKVQLGLKKSYQNLIAEMRDTTFEKSDLILQWKSLKEMNEKLKIQKQELERNNTRLTVETKQFENQKAVIAKLQKNFEESLKNQKKSETLNLAKMYENIKPAQAAKILDEMNNELASDILDNMKIKNSAKILEALTPEKAKILSELMTTVSPEKSSKDFSDNSAFENKDIAMAGDKK